MYGKGRIVTILPGHEADAYRVTGLQKIIASSTLWAARRLGPSGAKASSAEPAGAGRR
jgi:type 1 glutamine amidotransferase